MAFNEIEWRKRLVTVVSVGELENLLTEIPLDYKTSTADQKSLLEGLTLDNLIERQRRLCIAIHSDY